MPSNKKQKALLAIDAAVNLLLGALLLLFPAGLSVTLFAAGFFLMGIYLAMDKGV